MTRQLEGTVTSAQAEVTLKQTSIKSATIIFRFKIDQLHNEIPAYAGMTQHLD